MLRHGNYKLWGRFAPGACQTLNLLVQFYEARERGRVNALRILQEAAKTIGGLPQSGSDWPAAQSIQHGRK